MRPRIHSDLEGRKFGKLTVMSFCEPHDNRPGWMCHCDCGVEKFIVTGCLVSGSTISCGCHVRNITHGMSKSPEFNAWKGMKQRCLNPKSKAYPNYGGRGIRVCDRWLHSFENFLIDMGRRPSAAHSVERNDVNGNYKPSNCRWATKREQQNNLRTTRYLEFQGHKKSITEWSREVNIPVQTIRGRIEKSGWTLEAALTTPIKKQNSSRLRGEISTTNS